MNVHQRRQGVRAADASWATLRRLVKFHEPEIIPINLNSDVSPEDQIAMGVREKCEGLRVTMRLAPLRRAKVAWSES